MTQPKPDDPVDVRRLAPHQLGWLRRPELDTETANVWERPDGALVAASKHRPLVLEHLVGPMPPIAPPPAREVDHG